MASITFDIPDDRYSAFLRVAADFLDGAPASTEAPPTGEIGLANSDDAVQPWRFQSLHPSDEEFQRLIDYLRRVRAGYAGAVIDYLVNEGGPIDGDGLVDHLDLNSRRQVAGSLGHAARFATEVSRPFPVRWDRDTGHYDMDDDLREAIAQARLWTVPAPYRHVIDLDEVTLRLQSDAPARYAIFSPRHGEEPTKDDLVGLFHDADAALAQDANLLDRNGGHVVVELGPDRADGTHLLRIIPGESFGTRSERSHDLVTMVLPEPDFEPMEVLR